MPDDGHCENSRVWVLSGAHFPTVADHTSHAQIGQHDTDEQVQRTPVAGSLRPITTKLQHNCAHGTAAARVAFDYDRGGDVFHLFGTCIVAVLCRICIVAMYSQKCLSASYGRIYMGPK